MRYALISLNSWSYPEQCESDRLVAFFPGSSIGNFEPEDAMKLLKEVASMVGKGGRLLIGVDLKKDKAILDAAYNDAAGVTADFNLNILQHLQEQLQAEVEVSDFKHHAFYNETKGRVEMHLVSSCEQQIQLGDESIDVAAGERIHTESSYKYHREEFALLAGRAGFEVEQVWTDDQCLFSVIALVAN